MDFPIEAKLKDGTPIHLTLAEHRDSDPLRRLFQAIIEEGASYPHDRHPGQADFMAYWFAGTSTIVAYQQGSPRGADLLGAFYLKPNWPGRARHVANAGFMVAPQWRNKGLGWLLGAVMLQYATELGYRSVIFNLVFAENEAARRLWRKLGFCELAVLPGAVLKNDRTYQDAIIMWKSLLP